MIKKVFIKEHKKKLSNRQFSQIKKLIHEQNPTSVIAQFNDDLLKKYLNKCILSNFIYLFSCNIKKEIIGYAVFVKKPHYLFSEINNLKFKILSSLIINLKLITIFNLILKFFSLEDLFISAKNKLIIENNLNLNLLAIASAHQSKGLGTFFLRRLIAKLNKNKRFKYLTLESIEENAFVFYKKKFSFKLVGIKIRFFKNLKVMVKKLA